MSMAELRTVSGTWDELLDPEGNPRPACEQLVRHLGELGLAELQQRQDLAELDIVGLGITFTVYSDGRGIDRAWPFDVIPRVFAASEWAGIEIGLAQRLRALNLFIDDLYHDQVSLRDGIVPRELLESSPGFRPECIGISPAHRVWAHICGSDLVRDHDGKMEPVMKLAIDRAGLMSPADYDRQIGDLVNYMTYMAEPVRVERTQLGILVLFFLVIAFFVTLALKHEYWKDVR